jgi:hypothetical protein
LELRNSCEGVGEEQATGYFTDGCKEGSLMKHKLNRAEPKTMAEFMAIADKHASADSAARVLCIYVLLSHEGQAENHLYIFPYDLNTRLTFIVSFS